MHAEVIRLSRCPCCQSKYSTNGVRKTNLGKSAARQAQKKALRRELRSDND